MRDLYVSPHTKVCPLLFDDELLKSTFINVGGTGSFDVKEQEDWELEEEPTPNPLPPIEVKNVWNKQW